jgi:hypothetical protein
LPTDPTPADVPRYPSGCLQPVLMRGRIDHIDGTTGELLHRYTTVHEPGGVLPIACKTRRASRCPPCAEVYRADTYQLIRAGSSPPRSASAVHFHMGPHSTPTTAPASAGRVRIQPRLPFADTLSARAPEQGPAAWT